MINQLIVFQTKRKKDGFVCLDYVYYDENLKLKYSKVEFGKPYVLLFCEEYCTATYNYEKRLKFKIYDITSMQIGVITEYKFVFDKRFVYELI